jgi:hypothetical protein
MNVKSGTLVCIVFKKNYEISDVSCETCLKACAIQCCVKRYLTKLVCGICCQV